MNRIIFWMVCVVIAGSGCNCGGNIGQDVAGRILVTPDPIAFSQVEIGDSEDIFIVIGNVNVDETLTVFEMTVEAEGGGELEGIELTNVPEFPLELEPASEVEFTMTYAPQEGDTPPKGALVFRSTDDRFSADNPLRVPIEALANAPRIEAVPRTVRFARLPPGERDSQVVEIRNVGSAPLRLWEAPTYSGGADFRLGPLDGVTFPLELEVFDADAATNTPEDYVLELLVDYAPQGNGADLGEIRLVSNDPSGVADGTEDGQIRAINTIEVQANADAPCILVDGTTRNFGQVPIGEVNVDVVQIENCGSQPLEISSIRITENSDDNEFELNLQSWDANDDGELDATVTLSPGEEDTFFIRYTPVQVGSDIGEIVIGSNDPVQSQLTLDLIGRGSEGICPEAIAGAYIRGVDATPRPNISAAPLQNVVLDGSASNDPDGRIDDYIWEVVSQPPGSAVVLGPTEEDPNNQDFSKREFRLLVTGEYIVELKVRDNEGFTSCGDPARVIIRAVPNEKILVELTWTNPEDPDETDDVGSDVDIHLVKMGPGAWFETPYDIYFRNPNNGDGGQGIWNPESPSLDIDDRNGGGPENIQMDDPANCEWYAVGVHYYRQIFGTAYVTVRIFINAQLVYETINKPMSRGGQFWDVSRIHWDTGQIYDNSGNIMEAAPAGLAPEVTPGMINSGLCTNQNLYMIQ